MKGAEATHGHQINITAGDFGDGLRYEASATSFPHLFLYGETEEEALELMNDSIRITVECFAEQGKQV